MDNDKIRDAISWCENKQAEVLEIYQWHENQIAIFSAIDKRKIDAYCRAEIAEWIENHTETLGAIKPDLDNFIAIADALKELLENQQKNMRH